MMNKQIKQTEDTLASSDLSSLKLDQILPSILLLCGGSRFVDRYSIISASSSNLFVQKKKREGQL